MKSWKTSLGGILAAVGMALIQSDDSVIKAIGVIIGALGTLLLGFAAKDSNVTGGTKEQ